MNLRWVGRAVLSPPSATRTPQDLGGALRTARPTAADACIRWNPPTDSRGCSRWRAGVAVLLTVLLLGLPGAASGQTPELVQTANVPLNLISTNGVPLSSTNGNPYGSDGRLAVSGHTTLNPPTPKQWQAAIFFSGLTVIPTDNVGLLNPDLSLAANAENLDLPRVTAGDGTTVVLLRAQVGAPFIAQGISFLFGAVIPVPDTDEAGLLLATNVAKTDYWVAEPYTTISHVNSGYHWSSNAAAVFGNQAGRVELTWKKRVPATSQPADYGTNASAYFVDGGNYYRLYRQTYRVSGSPAKEPKQMYWTEGVFSRTCRRVDLRAIPELKVAFSAAFPQSVSVSVGAGASDASATGTNTLWTANNLLLAYNVEGRVLVELLGNEVNGLRQHLGVEIVDVTREPSPADVAVELGERLQAYAEGTADADLYPEALAASLGFVHRQATVDATLASTFYAIRETTGQNDVLLHWLKAGLEGVRWPFRYVRYRQAWPTNPARYSHYVRPLVATDAEAQVTAVPLPGTNTPAIAFQDALDELRGKLTATSAYYSFLSRGYPAHRALLQFSSGEHVAFERVFSWLDEGLKTNSLLNGSVATTLNGWNPDNTSFTFPDALQAPRVVEQTVNVGDRIVAPGGEAGAAGAYLAGFIRSGTAYDPTAYVDPFTQGFTKANLGAILPVNANPLNNTLDVWWFRENAADTTKGFARVQWPEVIGRYTLQWPASPREIIFASNAGSGPLGSLEAKGRIYYQNNAALTGYNPNEEHALMLDGQVYALRDELNVVTGDGYSSGPYVLLAYTEADARPAMSVFKVMREKVEAGVIFDYVVEAGKQLQAPMPLPLLPQPVRGSGQDATSYNYEPDATSANEPTGWSSLTLEEKSSGTYSHYQRFTYEDRKHAFWVYRGLHAGQPKLELGTYAAAGDKFGAFQPATALKDTDFKYYPHVSRRQESLTLTASNLPAGLTVSTDSHGFVIGGRPTVAVTNLLVTLVVTDAGDGAAVTNSLTITVTNNGAIMTRPPLAISSLSSYANAEVLYTNRPPFLAYAPTPANSFTMRFYYKQDDALGFAWPGLSAPADGAIVPWLRKADDRGAFTSSDTPALDIVYRPYWPAISPTLNYGATLTDPKNGLPAVRGQTSAQLLYQQSLATNSVANPKNTSVTLHDPTREKIYLLTNLTTSTTILSKLPAGVRTETYQGLTYFPSLPPHLAQRLWYDPARGTKGALVFKGEFKNELTGDDYLLLNVLGTTDQATLKALCPTGDNDKTKWNTAVDGLAATVETFKESTTVPGTYVTNGAHATVLPSSLVVVTNSDTAVDSYALSANGPGSGYVTLLVGNGRAFTPEAEPVSVYIFRIAAPLYTGQVKIVPSANPLNELLTLQHTADLAARTDEYEYQWAKGAPVDGFPPTIINNVLGTGWISLTNGNDISRYTLGGSGIDVLVDNYITLRYRPKNTAHPLYSAASAATATNWSGWTTPALAEGWVKRVLAGINPFNQRVTDLFNNTVNTDASVLTSAGKRWEGDIALNLENINNYGLIEIYETVLRRAKAISIESGINYGPANDTLLLAAGYLNDLYGFLGNEAYADAANPTIGIGSKDQTYGDIATSLFAFKGQTASLLEEELALLRGRDDFAQPGVQIGPVYNRLVWNYTRGVDSGEIIYVLNYDILDHNLSGVVDASDAAKAYPQGHGDAYGHYLTGLKNYYALLMDTDFDWVPRIEAVNVLGLAVSVDYQDERKFAATASSLARTGNQVFDLTWRQGYQSGTGHGWSHFSEARANAQHTYAATSGGTNAVTRHWGLDQVASRAAQGTYLNWIVGNAILPDVDPDPSHEGIQKVDRTTVPELMELVALANSLQIRLDNAAAGQTPLNLPESSIPFDLNPNTIVGASPQPHFEQVLERAKTALRNALVAFDESKDVTRLMRSEQDSLADYQYAVTRQELAYTNALIELYGTPYTDDIGPGKTFISGYAGPDLLHYMYVDKMELDFGDDYTPAVPKSFDNTIESNWGAEGSLSEKLNFKLKKSALDTSFLDEKAGFVSYTLSPHGFYGKPPAWTGRRSSPGRLQLAVSGIILARNRLYITLDSLSRENKNLIYAGLVARSQQKSSEVVSVLERDKLEILFGLDTFNLAFDGATEVLKVTRDFGTDFSLSTAEGLPMFFIAGLASGGDLTAPARSGIMQAAAAQKAAYNFGQAGSFARARAFEYLATQKLRAIDYHDIADLVLDQQELELLFDVIVRLDAVKQQLPVIDQRLQEMDDAQRHYAALVAEGERVQLERQVFRQRAGAVVQGYRTRDAAFRVFRNEKLERYKTLFDLASQYAFMAAKAYDYDTGLLGTTAGQGFVNRIVQSRALGVVKDGQPQYAGSTTGDPGLSSALAELEADWLVVKGRMGFNNPDAYGTTFSLRTEKFRILPDSSGDTTWRDVLQRARLDNVLIDADVKRYCLSLDPGNATPVPGIVLEFSTTISGALNFFGQPLAAGDHQFSKALFATKIFAAGVALPGYQGMDNPAANSGAVTSSGGTSPTDPTVTFTSSSALAATPYIYLIPVGLDTMRSPPLGDVGTVRTWSVDDVTIPLPFNLGASAFSSKALWQSSDSLTEQLFNIRKHQPFRPVSDAGVFSYNIYNSMNGLARSQFTNTRLIGRSAWNTKWKLVIPGTTLLNDPEDGLDRFINSVKDVKIHLVTYSYSGN